MNMFDLTGKVALVTGGAHSIGFAMGVGLVKAGATLCFNCSSGESCRKGRRPMRKPVWKPTAMWRM